MQNIFLLQNIAEYILKYFNESTECTYLIQILVEIQETWLF